MVEQEQEHKKTKRQMGLASAEKLELHHSDYSDLSIVKTLDIRYES